MSGNHVLDWIIGKCGPIIPVVLNPEALCLKEWNFQVFDNYAVTVMIGGEPYTLGLFDTAGQVCDANIYLLNMLT